MPILVASEGMSRVELFQAGELIDTVNVHRYSADELNELLEEMGQKRDRSMSWDRINAEKDFDNMLNNWGAYKDIIKSDDEPSEGRSEEL